MAVAERGRVPVPEYSEHDSRAGYEPAKRASLFLLCELPWCEAEAQGPSNALGTELLASRLHLDSVATSRGVRISLRVEAGYPQAEFETR